MNKAILIGRITADPIIKPAGETQVCKFSIAVDRKNKTADKSADFINCVAWGKTAEFISKYFRQGSKIAIEGHIQTGSYEKEGRKIYTFDVVIESVEFADSKKPTETKEAPQEVPSEWIPPESVEIDLPFK